MLIRLASATLRVSEPYASGHRLTAAEARALNKLRAQRLRQQLTAVALSASSVEALSELVATADREFSFAAAPAELVASRAAIAAEWPGALPAQIEELARKRLAAQRQAADEALAELFA